MNGFTCGVFGTNPDAKSDFENSISKKSEVEGIIVYHKSQSGTRYSFLDDPQFPDKIQGYSRIASLCDYAYYVFPPGGKLTAPDGELAVLLDSYQLRGTVEILDSSTVKDQIRSSFKGLSLSDFSIEERQRESSVIDLSKIQESQSFPKSGSVVYIDRAFNVKGVGVVVLGFILSGKVSLHDKLRLLPGELNEKYAEVKGIQVSDEDYNEAGRGIRVGLSLKGIDLKDLDKVSWLDDGSFSLSNKIELRFNSSPYYRQSVIDRDMHIQMPGELLVAKISKGTRENVIVATLQSKIPVWKELRACIVDLNAKNLRIAGGGTIEL